MNVYDFDKTIYNGDSTADFIIWETTKNPLLALRLARGGFSFLMYKANLASKTYYKEKIYYILQHIPNIKSEVELFWDEHFKNIKKWYLDAKKDDDVIISASPEFLLQPAMRRLGLKNLLASSVDTPTGFYNGINCYGEEKVRRFKEKFSDEIDNFYSDSISDKPLACLAKQAYLVEGDILINWNPRTLKPSEQQDSSL